MGLKEAIDAARLCAAKISNEAERLAMTAALNDVQNASRSDSGKKYQYCRNRSNAERII